MKLRASVVVVPLLGGVTSVTAVFDRQGRGGVNRGRVWVLLVGNKNSSGTSVRA